MLNLKDNEERLNFFPLLIVLWLLITVQNIKPINREIGFAGHKQPSLLCKNPNSGKETGVRWGDESIKYIWIIRNEWSKIPLSVWYGGAQIHFVSDERRLLWSRSLGLKTKQVTDSQMKKNLNSNFIQEKKYQAFFIPDERKYLSNEFTFYLIHR